MCIIRVMVRDQCISLLNQSHHYWSGEAQHDKGTLMLLHSLLEDALESGMRIDSFIVALEKNLITSFFETATFEHKPEFLRVLLQRTPSSSPQILL